MKKLVGVTGASGHLGGVVIRQLLESGYAVRVLKQRDDRAFAGLELEIFPGNICDAEAMLQFAAGTHAVIHTAALISLGEPMSEKIWQINVEGTRNVARACLKAGARMVHVSSVHVFEQEPVNEVLDENRKMVGSVGYPYDVTKAAAHRLVQEMCKEGLDAVLICPGSIVGPPDFKPSMVGSAIADMLKGKIPAVFEGGFDFTDVRDVAAACVKAVEAPVSGETFILCGKYYSMKELSIITGNAAGKQIRIPEIPIWVARLLAPIMHYWSKIIRKPPLFTKETVEILIGGNRYISSEKAARLLDYQPRPFEETLKDYVQWYRDNAHLWDKHK